MPRLVCGIRAPLLKIGAHPELFPSCIARTNYKTIKARGGGTLVRLSCLAVLRSLFCKKTSFKPATAPTQPSDGLAPPQIPASVRHQETPGASAASQLMGGAPFD